jgi:hypothetical protein
LKSEKLDAGGGEPRNTRKTRKTKKAKKSRAEKWLDLEAGPARKHSGFWVS